MTQPEHVNVEINEALVRRIENALPNNPKAGRTVEEFMTGAAARWLEFLKSTLPSTPISTSTSPTIGPDTKDDHKKILQDLAAAAKQLVAKAREDDEYSHGAVEAGWSALDGHSAPVTQKEKDQVVKDLALEFRKLKQPRGSF